jgi:hypothetical protein
VVVVVEIGVVVVVVVVENIVCAVPTIIRA